MFWNKKALLSVRNQSRKEPPLTGAEKDARLNLDSVSNNIDVYAELLEVSSRVDPVAYRRDFGKAPKNASGIPLAFEEQAETVGRIIASAYEERYDLIKAQMRDRGMQFFAPVVDDSGQLITVNFAAMGAAPTVSTITDESDLMPYGLAGLHWLLATPDFEWVFGHLVEATGAYFRSHELRKQIDPVYFDDFDDLRDLLKGAFQQYLHRNV